MDPVGALWLIAILLILNFGATLWLVSEIQHARRDIRASYQRNPRGPAK